MKKGPILAVIAILAVSAYFVFDYFAEKEKASQILASGTIETTDIEVGSRVGGRISAVDAEEGDSVKRGDVLLRMDPYQLPAQQAQLESQRAQAEAQLLALEQGPRPQEIAAARASYRQAQAQASLVASGARSEEIAQAAANTRQAQADLDNARTNQQRFQLLLDRRVVSQQEYDTANTTFLAAREQVNAAHQKELELRRGNRPQEIIAARQQAQAAQEQLQLLEAGTRPEDIAAQRALVASITAQLQEVADAKDELSVNAPCMCQISSLNVKAGQLMLPNQTVASLINLNDLWVRVYIPEERFGQVKVGDKVLVKVDPFPNQDFKGRVVQLASRAEFTPRNVQTQETRKIQVFGVKVALDNSKRLLRPGMPADVTFDVSQALKE